jgi:hypothetical protein
MERGLLSGRKIASGREPFRITEDSVREFLPHNLRCSGAGDWAVIIWEPSRSRRNLILMALRPREGHAANMWSIESPALRARKGSRCQRVFELPLFDR